MAGTWIVAQFATQIHTHMYTHTPSNAHECRGTAKVQFWVRVSEMTNIISLFKYRLAKRVGDSDEYVVSFCLDSSRQRLTLVRRHTFIYSSNFWVWAMRPKVIIAPMYTHARTNKPFHYL